MTNSPRKILSLKENCSRIPDTKPAAGRLPDNGDTSHALSEGGTSLDLLAKNNTGLYRLQEERQAILFEIKMLKQRLIFTSSMPLQKACNELKKKDLDILCRINEYLIAYPNCN